MEFYISAKSTIRTPGIYYFHIPKTAGMSVWHFLDQVFPSEKICPWWLWDQLVTATTAELEGWDVFRGHFLAHLEPYLGRELATFTFLRDPVERTISHYYHVRRARDHPWHKHVLQVSLEQFCVDPETQHVVKNYQACYLAKSPQYPAAAVKNPTAESLARFELAQRMEYPDPLHLVRARERTDKPLRGNWVRRGLRKLDSSDQ